MAIEVKHGSDPAALAAVSFGGSQGAARSRLNAGMLAATEQRLGAERNREFVTERDAERAQPDQQNMLASQAGQREMIDYRNNADIATAQTKFTDKQRQEFTQMNQAYEDARKSGDFSEPELKEIRKQIAAKQAMIEPLPELPEDRVDPWAQAQKKLFTDPTSRQRGFIKANGDLEFLPDPVDAKREEYTKRYRELAKEKITETKNVMVAGKSVPTPTQRSMTPEEIKKAIEDEQAAVDAYMNPKEAEVQPVGALDPKFVAEGRKALLSMPPEDYRAEAEKLAKEKGVPVKEVLAFLQEKFAK